MARLRRPVNAELITTYERLRFLARKFGHGLYNCLIFVGPPGRLKSSIIEDETKGKAHVIEGTASPFEAFCELQEHKDELVIIDDADGLYKESSGQRLLKLITNPKKPARVSHTTDAPNKRGLEKSFTTSSPVCIIDNAWNIQNEHIAALEDRSRLFLFDPSPRELHLEMERQEWFNDEEIYNFIGDNLQLFTELSARIYVKAAEAKTAGENWREYILKSCINSKDKEMILLEYEEAWKEKPVEEKAQEFLRRTGMTARGSYFRRRRQLIRRLAGHPVVGRWIFSPTPSDLDED
jgi:hypothetical protein